MNAPTSKKVGRPPASPDGPKRAAIGLRASNDLRSRLEAAAAETGRSLSQEAEIRLEQSFESDSAFGGAEQAALLRMMAAAAQLIEARTGKSWLEDFDTGYAVSAAWRQLVNMSLPHVPDDDRAALDIEAPERPAYPTPPKWPDDYKAGPGLLFIDPESPENKAVTERHEAAVAEYEK